MKVILAAVIFSCLFAVIETRHFGMQRNVVKNLNKAIINFCNKEAHIQIQDEELFNCFHNKQATCDIYPKYSEFNAIRSECINNKNGECGTGVVIGLLLWGLILLAMQA
jgi:hypothetical protein